MRSILEKAPFGCRLRIFVNLLAARFRSERPKYFREAAILPGHDYLGCSLLSRDKSMALEKVIW